MSKFEEDSKYNQDEYVNLLKPLKYFNPWRVKEYHYFIKILRSFNVWLNVEQETVEEILSLTTTITANFIIVDDIQDNSLYRGGLPSSHVKFGLPATVNATNLVTFIMIEKFLDLHGLEALTIYKDAGITVCRGQGMEIYWINNLQCPSEEEYMKNITDKTASVCILAVKLMQLFSGNKTDLTKITNMLGAFMQLYNDYIDLASPKYMTQKQKYCEDIALGKFSLPVIHAIKSRPDDHRVMNIIKTKTEDDEIKKECVALLEEFGSILYTKEFLLKLKNEIFEEIERIGPNPLLVRILEGYYNEYTSNI